MYSEASLVGRSPRTAECHCRSNSIRLYGSLADKSFCSVFSACMPRRYRGAEARPRPLAARAGRQRAGVNHGAAARGPLQRRVVPRGRGSHLTKLDLRVIAYKLIAILSSPERLSAE